MSFITIFPANSKRCLPHGVFKITIRERRIGVPFPRRPSAREKVSGCKKWPRRQGSWLSSRDRLINSEFHLVFQFFDVAPPQQPRARRLSRTIAATICGKSAGNTVYRRAGAARRQTANCDNAPQNQVHNPPQNNRESRIRRNRRGFFRPGATVYPAARTL